MSADRELLEMAAKAAEIEVAWHSSSQPVRLEAGGPFGKIASGFWNPLNDDGDCARLEAALLIELLWHDDGVQAGRRCDSFAVYEDFEGRDRNTVRRRVSVEIAAAIGEAMP